jgi:serine/threonine protein kinase
LAVSLNELAFCKRSASGTRQSLRVINPFCTTRDAILVLIFSTEKPGLSFPTTKPLTWFAPSSRAQITLMLAKVALPIHFFWPLKFPKPLEGADRPMRDAFLREMWIASRVRSPFVGEVIQLAPDRQTQLYLAMPFYDGEMLESRIKRKPMLSLTAGLDIALKIARGLLAMHRAGVIHRDIKPDNIILCSPIPGQPTTVKIIDFGVARQTTALDIGVIAEPGTRIDFRNRAWRRSSVAN